MPAARSGKAPGWWLSFNAFQKVPSQLAHNLVFKISKACAIAKMDGLAATQKRISAAFPFGTLWGKGYCRRVGMRRGVDAPQE